MYLQLNVSLFAGSLAVDCRVVPQGVYRVDCWSFTKCDYSGKSITYRCSGSTAYHPVTQKCEL